MVDEEEEVVGEGEGDIMKGRMKRLRERVAKDEA